MRVDNYLSRIMGNEPPLLEVENPSGYNKNDNSNENVAGISPDPEDVLATIEKNAIEALRANELLEKLQGHEGVAWGTLKAFFKSKLPVTLDDLDNRAFWLVPKAMNEIFGIQDQYWHSYKHFERKTTYVKTGKKE